MIYTLTLNPALDFAVYTDKIHLGSINRADESNILCGGKGINVSYVLNNLGDDTTALGFIAGFTGNELERILKAQGIICDFITLKSGYTRINIKLKEQLETDINTLGPDIDTASLSMLFKKVSSLKSGDTLCLCGNAPSALGEEIYADIIKNTPSGVRIVVDAEKEFLLNTLPLKPFLIKPNFDELCALFNTTPKCDEEIVSLAKTLCDKGAENVLVSLGGDGAILVTKSGDSYRAKAPNGTAINTVGAGDSAVAGFIHGYKSGDIENALRFAVAAGSASAFSKNLATPKEINELLDKVKITRIK